jgi:hypothetical protein
MSNTQTHALHYTAVCCGARNDDDESNEYISIEDYAGKDIRWKKSLV